MSRVFVSVGLELIMDIFAITYNKASCILFQLFGNVLFVTKTDFDKVKLPRYMVCAGLKLDTVLVGQGQGYPLLTSVC